MTLLKSALAITGVLAVSACSHLNPREQVEAYRPETPGSNLMMRAPITVSDNLEVIISDVVIPPNAVVPAHYHKGEEFIYLIEGSVEHRESDKPPMILKAGDTYAIPPNVAHSPIGGPQGGRAIVFRVHAEGEPERILVDDFHSHDGRASHIHNEN